MKLIYIKTEPTRKYSCPSLLYLACICKKWGEAILPPVGFPLITLKR